MPLPTAFISVPTIKIHQPKKNLPRIRLMLETIETLFTGAAAFLSLILRCYSLTEISSGRELKQEKTGLPAFRVFP
jgi:hypothetical protein